MLPLNPDLFLQIGEYQNITPPHLRDATERIAFPKQEKKTLSNTKIWADGITEVTAMPGVYMHPMLKEQCEVKMKIQQQQLSQES
jgi:hypothetical protein